MKFVLALLTMIVPLSAPASADESVFLQPLSGNWSGEGSARRTADGNPIGINCQFTTEADANTLNLDGQCRALAIVRQSISATLNNTGGSSYQGTYVGPNGGQSGLTGARSGNTIDLEVAWAEPVNGDNQARMQLEVTGENAMVIRTIDTSPTTGSQVVTSEINLTKN